MAKQISSVRNREVMAVRRLYERKYRLQERKFIIEGIRQLEEAARAAANLDTVYFAAKLRNRSRGEDLLVSLRQAGARCVEVSDAVFAQMADTNTPQGILAVVRWTETTVSEMTAQKNPLLVVVDGVQDPGNLGTIIRTADAAGADGVITLPGTVDIFNPKAVRSAMGSLLHVPVLQAEDAVTLLAQLKTAQVRLIVGDVAAAQDYDAVDWRGRVALAVGSEAAGPGAAVRSMAAVAVKIPLLGKAESLNAGVAASILLYEAVRQRKKTILPR